MNQCCYLRIVRAPTVEPMFFNIYSLPSYVQRGVHDQHDYGLLCQRRDTPFFCTNRPEL